jgi:hypothetical protein
MNLNRGLSSTVELYNCDQCKLASNNTEVVSLCVTKGNKQKLRTGALGANTKYPVKSGRLYTVGVTDGIYEVRTGVRR